MTTTADPATRWPAPGIVAVGAAVLYAPTIGLGYGTDVDIANLRQAGASILDGEYRFARGPGAFPHEALTGILDRIGGAPAVVAGSLAAGTLALWLLGRLVEEDHGRRRAVLAVVLVATQAWFWMAATSLGDYAYALAALLGGFVALRRDAPIRAGLLLGLAVGFRASSVVGVLAILLATWPPRRRTASTPPAGSTTPADVPARRSIALAGAIAALSGVAWFIPPWLSVERSGRFLSNQLVVGDGLVALARWGVKNLAFFGLPATLVLCGGAGVLLGAARRWHVDPLVRFALLTAVAAEAVFLRFPWKPIHLLPVAVAVAILVATSPRLRTGFAVALVAANLSLAVVSFQVAAPDTPDAATGGRFDPGLGPGVVVNDLRCRADRRAEGPWPPIGSPEAQDAAYEVFVCQAAAWRAGEDPVTGP